MKSQTPVSRLGAWLAVVLAPCQAAEPASPAASPKPDEAPLTMSPFTVSSSKDVGYTATNTLSGTRLNTPLRDVGAAVSIVTKEFLNDVVANDSGTLLPYTVNTEIGGVDGNYAGGDIAGGRAQQDNARAEPERNQRVRGLAAAELTRDYYLTDIPFDAYNTERVTVNRGPNSLLFGIGSPGGVVNHSTLAPVFGRNFYETKFQVGQRKSHRESFDFNREIVPRRLAVRVAGLNDRTEFQQRPAWEKDQRLFGAVTAVLAENGRSRYLGPTIVRANAEYGDISSNPPNVTPPVDAFSSWWSLPSRDLQQYTGTTFPAYYDDGTFVPQATIDGRTQQALPAPTVIPYFLQFSLIYPQPGRPHHGLAGPQFADLAGGQGRILWSGVPGRIRFDVYATRNALSGPEFIGFNTPSIQDRNVFDYYNVLYSGETNHATRDFRAGNVSLEQGFWNGRAGVELSYDYQRYRTANQLPFGGASADVGIDINRYLGNDELNPNLGRPFIRSNDQNDSDSRTERNTSRATAFVTFDGKELFGKGRAGFWFGRHTLTGTYMDNTIETHSRNYGHGIDSDTVNLTTLLSNTINGFRRQAGSLIYVGPSLLGADGPGDVRLQPVDAILPRDGDRFNMFYYDPAARAIRTAEFNVRRYLASGGIGRREIESSVASLQSYWLDSHLITIAGVRRDQQRVFQRLNLDNDPDPATSDRLPSGEFDPAAIRLQSEPSDVAKGDTVTWSIVGRYPDKVLPGLPFGAEVRVFANRSENFNPVGARRSVYNENLDAPTGTTKEYGFMLELFGGKLSARVNRFETAGESFTNAALQGAVSNALNLVQNQYLGRMLAAQTAGFTLEEAGLAQVGITSFDEAFREIIAFHPEPTRSARNLRIETFGGAPRVEGNPIVGVAATTSFVAKGWELDLTGNPAPGLRVMLNVARQETIKSNIAPDFRKLAADMRANIDQSPLRDALDSPTLGENVTYFGRFNNSVLTPLAAELAKEGTASLEQREWRVNTAVSYDFRERLKGWGIGAGARWQSEVSTGYPNFVGPDGTPIPDLTRPFLSDAEFNADGWLSYKKQIFKDRVEWKIQLNVRNLVGSDQPIVVATNPDGRAAIVRIPPDRQWFITNTFRF